MLPNVLNPIERQLLLRTPEDRSTPDRHGPCIAMRPCHCGGKRNVPGQFVISLDFELLWGVRDHADKASYGSSILGAREAVPRILDLFSKHGIRATWATVGFLFCEGKEHLLSVLPPPEMRPSYQNPALSNYNYLDDVGADERADPYYFAPTLIQNIATTLGQEIGTHTLSHCYCLEEGFTPTALEADLQVAQDLAGHCGISLSSIVFPRNQYAAEHLEVCRRLGLSAFRGSPSKWAYKSARGSDQNSLRRATRLLDAYSGVLGAFTVRLDKKDKLTNVPASRFLRPNSGRLGRLHPLHLNVVRRGMSEAARRSQIYHLWWHPHNFGRGLEANMSGLNNIINHYKRLADTHGMRSKNMADMI